MSLKFAKRYSHKNKIITFAKRYSHKNEYTIR